MKQYIVVVNIDERNLPNGWRERPIDEYAKQVIPIYMLQSMGAITVISVTEKEEQ